MANKAKKAGNSKIVEKGEGKQTFQAVKNQVEQVQEATEERKLLQPNRNGNKGKKTGSGLVKGVLIPSEYNSDLLTFHHNHRSYSIPLELNLTVAVINSTDDLVQKELSNKSLLESKDKSGMYFVDANSTQAIANKSINPATKPYSVLVNVACMEFLGISNLFFYYQKNSNGSVEFIYSDKLNDQIVKSDNEKIELLKFLGLVNQSGVFIFDFSESKKETNKTLTDISFEDLISLHNELVTCFLALLDKGLSHHSIGQNTKHVDFSFVDFMNDRVNSLLTTD